MTLPTDVNEENFFFQHLVPLMSKEENKPQRNFHFMLVFYLHFYLDLNKTIYIFIHLQPKYRVVTWLHHLLRLFA